MVELTKICDNCKSIINSNSIFCPKCRKDVRNYRQKFTSSMFFAFFVIVIVALIIIFLLKQYLVYFFLILLLFVIALGIGSAFKR